MKRRSVHPRLRGEHIPKTKRRLSYRGSSPPARGTYPEDTLLDCRGRFIPACAGNIRFWLSAMLLSPVHPRLRGEHRHRLGEPGHRLGSSPPARGTSADARPEFMRRRFIPACAGNISGSVCPSRHYAVHPRLRGEHIRESSGPVEVKRFIPACAGNIQPPPSCKLPNPVHPRLRGEHWASRRSSARVLGSSPPARGTYPEDTLLDCRGRFIPACAGNIPSPEPSDQGGSVHPRLRGEHA